MTGGCGMDLSLSGHGNELAGLIKCQEFID